MRKNYLAKLREEHHALIEEARLPLTKLNFDIPEHLLQGMSDRTGQEKKLLEALIELQKEIALGTSYKNFRNTQLHRVKNMTNRHRGWLGEFIAALFLSRHEQMPYSEIEKDSAVFITPHGKRRVDCYCKNIAVEVKSGYACYSKFTRVQIAKDNYLLNDKVKKYYWLFVPSRVIICHEGAILCSKPAGCSERSRPGQTQ